LLEEAKPHWVGAAIAAIGALGSAAMSADAQSKSAGKAAAGAATPKGDGGSNFTPTANAFAGPKQGTGADLSATFGKSALPALPQGQSAADVFRVADALGKSDFSSQGAPPPVPGSAAAPVTDFGASRPTIGDAEASLPAGGSTSGGGGDWLEKAKLYAQLGSMTGDALRGPQVPGGGIPQASGFSYSPTADAAQRRLQQLMMMRRGF